MSQGKVKKRVSYMDDHEEERNSLKQSLVSEDAKTKQ